MLNEKARYGAFQAINNCIRLQKNEQVCIISDRATMHIAEALRDEAVKAGGSAVIFSMDDYGPRPEDGSNPLKFPDEIGECLKKSQASIYAATRFKGEQESFRSPMLRLIESLPTIRHAHMPNVTTELMETGMNSDYAKVQEITKRVHEIVSASRVIKVRTAKGTDLTIDINPDWKWMTDDGRITPLIWRNLPAGEVYTCVKNINGTAIIDGVLGDFLCAKHGLIDKRPITLTIENDRVVKIVCADKNVEQDVIEYSKQDENANRIGELGIGTNIGLKGLVGIMLQDEKFPGVHLAMGHGYPQMTGSDWNSKAHLDMVIQKTTIEVDGRTIMQEGVFTI